MESFFALLQKNVLDRQHWGTRQALRIALVTWLERTYQRRRRQAALGRLTPIEYETITHPDSSGCVAQPVTYSCSSPEPSCEGQRDQIKGSRGSTQHPLALDQSALLDVLVALKANDVDDRTRSAATTIYQALIEAELTAVIKALPAGAHQGPRSFTRSEGGTCRLRRAAPIRQLQHHGAPQQIRPSQPLLTPNRPGRPAFDCTRPVAPRAAPPPESADLGIVVGLSLRTRPGGAFHGW